MSFDAETEQVEQVDDAQGDANADGKSNHVHHFAFGGDGAGRHGLFYDASVVGSCGQCDGIFLTFLQQHDVEGVFDFLLAGDSHEFLLLLGSIADAAFVFARLPVNVVPGDLKSFQHTAHRGFHIVAHGFDARVQIDNGRIAF